MALNKRMVIASIIATATSSSGVLTLVNAANTVLVTVPGVAAVATGGGAAIATEHARAINAAALVFNGAKIAASASGTDLYVVYVEDSANPVTRFDGGAAVSEEATAANLGFVAIQTPYVDPYVGYYSKTNLLTSIAAAIVATRLAT